MTTFDRNAGLWIEVCCVCETRFGMSDAVFRVAVERRERGSFTCPNGHDQHYPTGESEETKLRRERDRLKQDAARLEDEIRHQRERRVEAERRASAMKGVATRMKNRIKAGVCPCCNRTFQDLARHMASKHPNIDNVIDFETVKEAAQ